jgi:two-component system cell cycle response regulator DivK
MSRKRILIVEDNLANRVVFQDLLEGAGYEVRCTDRAEDALPLAKDVRPDLILMDIQLAGMDGLTATKLLRDDELTRGIPIVALTSYAMPGDRERFLVAGCNGYITKPIRIDTFRKEIASMLESTQAAVPGGSQSPRREAALP